MSIETILKIYLIPDFTKMVAVSLGIADRL